MVTRGSTGPLKSPAPVEEKPGPRYFSLSAVCTVGRMWAANPSLPGEAAFHFGLFSFFYVVPRFVQTHGKRGGLEIFHLSNPGGWMDRSGEKARGEWAVPERRSNSILQDRVSVNACPTDLLRLEAPSRGHLICFPAF